MRNHSQKLEKQQKHLYSRAVSTLACRVDSLLTVLAILHIFCNLKEKEAVPQITFELNRCTFWQRIAMQIKHSQVIQDLSLEGCMIMDALA